MKKRLLSIVITLVLTATAAVGLSSCGSSDKGSASGDKQVVKLGIMGASDEEIWDPIVEEFAKKGVDIEYVTFSDYTQPNAALDGGDIDLNAFQHHKYLESEIEKNGYDITAIGDTLLTSLNLYSSKDRRDRHPWLDRHRKARKDHHAPGGYRCASDGGKDRRPVEVCEQRSDACLRS